MKSRLLSQELSLVSEHRGILLYPGMSGALALVRTWIK
jgi:hypothetical protein